MAIQNRNKLRIGITAGDPNGVGYEILLKLFADIRITDLFTPIIYGSKSALEFYGKEMKSDDRMNAFFIDNVEKCNTKRVNFISVDNSQFEVHPGQSTPEAGKIAIESLRAVTSDMHRGSIDAIVTGPIDKNNTYSESFPFVGHTGYFANEFPSEDNEPLMFMVSENIKVGLVTMHTAITDVPDAITGDNIVKHIHLLQSSLIKDFACTNPKIAVLSLNPHCGDGGVIGKEEGDIILPAIETADKDGIIVKGPFAADGFFGSGTYSKFDAVLAMYHDQGLAPFKSLARDGGVNFTAGLPIVRTSPAHGVGYDIAGTGTADVSSFMSAIFMAIDIVKNRRIYEEMTKNPLRYVHKRNSDKLQREQNVDEMLPEGPEE